MVVPHSGVQAALPFRAAPGETGVVRCGGRVLTVRFVRERRARRYVLRLDPDGTPRVTIPRGGSTGAARRFVVSQRKWIDKERYRRALTPPTPREWRAGTPILLRGRTCPLVVEARDGGYDVRLGELAIRAGGTPTDDLRPLVEAALRKVAEREMPPRLLDLANRHGLAVQKVQIRNQRWRWGSCSSSGRISLNWRLVQVPPDVCDYVLVHELMHLRVQNHSARFWRLVAAACPEHREARAWLRNYAERLW